MPVRIDHHPNPFSRTTEIRYRLPWDSPVRLDVLDAQGRLLATLIDGHDAEEVPLRIGYN